MLRLLISSYPCLLSIGIDDFATRVENTFLSIAEGAAADTVGKVIQSVILPATSVQVDLSPPNVFGFDIDLVKAEMILYFDETVDASTLDLTKFSLYSARSSTSSNFTFDQAFSLTSDNTSIIDVILSGDIDGIKLKRLCSSNLTCFITYVQGGVIDLNGQVSETLDISVAPSVTNLVADIVGPNIVLFNSIDLNTGIISLLMDEPTVQSSIDLTAFSLNSLFTGELSVYSLQASTLMYVTLREIVFQLGSSDLLALKSDPLLCSYRGNCYASFTSTFIEDFYGNPATAVSIEMPGYIVHTFIPDMTRPILSSYSLDLTNKFLNLTFDEPVSLPAFRLDGISLHPSPDSAEYFIFLSSIASQSIPNQISISISKEDFNLLKDTIISRSAVSTILSLSASSVRDTALFPNYIKQIFSNSSFIPSLFVQDTVAPFIIAFEVNLDKDHIVITFSETINSTSAIFGGFTLYGMQYNFSSTSVNLNNSEIFSIELNEFYTITLLPPRISIITLKTSPNIATLTSNTYLYVEGGSVSDNVLNIDQVNFIMASRLILDSERVMLLEYSINMNDGILLLTFSDVILSESFQPDAFIIQTSLSRSSALFYQLTSASIASNTNGYELMISLNSDLQGIKSQPGLVTSVNTTYLTIAADAIDDPFGVDVTAITDGNALQARSVIPDLLPPTLLDFSIDLGISILNLTFSDTVLLPSINLTRLTLQTQSNMTGLNHSENSFIITGGSIALFTDGTVVSISLLDNDSDQIKYIGNLRFLSFSSFLLQDISLNRVIPIRSSSAREVSVLFPDMINPQISAFSLDLNLGVIIITFNEVMLLSSIDGTAILLQTHSNISESTNNVYIGSGVARFHTESRDDLNVIQLKFHDDILNIIKSDLNFGISSANTFLSLVEILGMPSFSGIGRDLGNLPTILISPYLGIPVSTIVPDLSPIILNSYVLDLNNGIVNLTFSESVNPATFTPTALNFQNYKYTNETIYSLSSETNEYFVTNHTTLTIRLGFFDLNQIKNISTLAVDENSTFITFNYSLCSDFNGNPIIEIDNGMALQTSEFISDETQPQLISFSLDFNTGLLHLYFSEILNSDAIYPELIQLRNSSNVSSEIPLTNSTYILLLTSESAILVIEVYPLNEVKGSSIGLTSNSTFVNFNYGAVSDTNLNPISEVLLSSASLTPDTTPPTFVYFSLNLTSGLLVLVFDESISSNSLNTSGITLVSSPNSTSQNTSYTLTSTSLVISNDEQVTRVQLGAIDLNSIKLLDMLATSPENTYLSIEANSLSDLRNNFNLAVTISMAPNVHIFSPDLLAPILTSFNFDLNLGILTLFFSETVNTSTLNLTTISLQASVSSPDQIISISGGIFLSEPASSLNVTLIEYDLNLLKFSNQLATNSQNTFLSTLDNTVRDMNGIPMSPISRNAAVKVTQYISDTTKPFVQFAMFDMNSSVITLGFSETVIYNQIYPSFLTILSIFRVIDNTTVDRFTLTSGIVSQINSSVVRIRIDVSDLDIIKGLSIVNMTGGPPLLSFPSEFVCHRKLKLSGQAN